MCPLRNVGRLWGENQCRNSQPPTVALRLGLLAILLPVPAPTIAPTRQFLYACHPRPVNGYGQGGEAVIVGGAIKASEALVAEVEGENGAVGFAGGGRDRRV